MQLHKCVLSRLFFISHTSTCALIDGRNCAVSVHCGKHRNLRTPTPRAFSGTKVSFSDQLSSVAVIFPPTTRLFLISSCFNLRKCHQLTDSQSIFFSTTKNHKSGALYREQLNQFCQIYPQITWGKAKKKTNKTELFP